MLLKCPGRIGHSTAFGSAIWAEQLGQTSIAISLSGCGEALIRTHLAEKLAANIVKWLVFNMNFFNPLKASKWTSFDL